jgi:hypothetical protein
VRNNFLIIGIPRSGTTSLMKSIASAYDLPYIFEPFRGGIKQFEIDNIVFKTQLSQINDEYYTEIVTELHLEKCVDFYTKFSKQFDKTILIVRNNILENAQSLSVQNNGMEEMSKYVYYPELYEETASKLVDKIKLINQYMILLSNELSIPIDKYEDVYYGNGLNDKSIKLDISMLDNSKKYRQYDSNLNNRNLI